MGSVELSNCGRRLITVAATLTLVVLVAVAVWWTRRISLLADKPLAKSPAGERPSVQDVPFIPPSTKHVLPPIPLELPPEPQVEIVIDVDRNGKLQVDGKPTELAALRNLLALRQFEAGGVGVTIRADERCRFYHVRQVIRACDETAGVPYKLQPLPEESEPQSS